MANSLDNQRQELTNAVEHARKTFVPQSTTLENVFGYNSKSSLLTHYSEQAHVALLEFKRSAHQSPSAPLRASHTFSLPQLAFGDQFLCTEVEVEWSEYDEPVVYVLKQAHFTSNISEAGTQSTSPRPAAVLNLNTLGISMGDKDHAGMALIHPRGGLRSAFAMTSLQADAASIQPLYYALRSVPFSDFERPKVLSDGYARLSDQARTYTTFGNARMYVLELPEGYLLNDDSPERERDHFDKPIGEWSEVARAQFLLFCLVVELLPVWPSHEKTPLEVQEESLHYQSYVQNPPKERDGNYTLPYTAPPFHAVPLYYRDRGGAGRPMLCLSLGQRERLWNILKTIYDHIPYIPNGARLEYTLEPAATSSESTTLTVPFGFNSTRNILVHLYYKCYAVNHRSYFQNGHDVDLWRTEATLEDYMRSKFEELTPGSELPDFLCPGDDYEHTDIGASEMPSPEFMNDDDSVHPPTLARVMKAPSTARRSVAASSPPARAMSESGHRVTRQTTAALQRNAQYETVSLIDCKLASTHLH